MQQRLIDWLAGKREIRLRGPDTDLRLGVTDRVWINCDGTNNFPDGEIFTGPVDEFFDLRAELPLGIARCQLALGHDDVREARAAAALATPIVTCLRIAVPFSAGVPLSNTSKRSFAGRPGTRPNCVVSNIFRISGRRCVTAYAITP